jgi:DNA-binding MurR/RpiR family transcriptional regulator
MKGKASKPILKAVDSTTYGSLRDRLLTHVNQLSRQQRLIAEYLLDNLHEVPFLSVPQLAQRSGASEATVVRLCQSIGFNGFSDMKMAVVETLREELNTPRPGGNADSIDAPEENVLEAVAELERHNITAPLQGIDREAFNRVAATLYEADHIFTFGLGISAHLAELAAYLFTEHGLRSNSFGTHFTSPREQLVTMRSSDVLVAFSFPPYSRQTLQVLTEAARRGMKTVVITDRLSPPAVPAADDALIVSTHGMTFTNATSSTNVVLNALIVEIASSHRGDTVDALSRINRILQDRSEVVDNE